MAVIPVAGTMPGLPPLPNGYEVHLISNLSKLWANIAILRPSILIIDENSTGLNAGKFCRDCKQNKTTSPIAIILVTKDPDYSGHADATISKPFESESFHNTIQKLLIN